MTLATESGERPEHVAEGCRALDVVDNLGVDRAGAVPARETYVRSVHQQRVQRDALLVRERMCDVPVRALPRSCRPVFVVERVRGGPGDCEVDEQALLVPVRATVARSIVSGIESPVDLRRAVCVRVPCGFSEGDGEPRAEGGPVLGRSVDELRLISGAVSWRKY